MKFAVVLLLGLAALTSASIGHEVDFDSLVKQLIPLIASDATEAGCSTVCTTGFASVLGPLTPLAGTVCGPLCKAALAELENHTRLGHAVDFDSLVKQLIPLIDSTATEAGCTTVCITGAASFMGPLAPRAGTVCGPLCKAALAELQKVAG